MVSPPPTLFCLHFLAGSAEEWRWLGEELGAAARLVVLDLPGFGDQAPTGGRDVAAMAEHVAGAIRSDSRPGGRWGLAGHSMGAKVALAVARRAEDGELGLEGLVTLLLLAGSPPAPEPMEDGQRAEMLSWFAGPPERSEAEARDYISRNTAAPLHPGRHEQALADVLRAHPGAWRDWLERGSREDWRGRIGILHTPALVVAGAEDAALGPDAQREHMLPHLARGSLVVMPGAAHLLPLERPAELAGLVRAHLEAPAGGAAPDGAFADLLASSRIAPALRDVLRERACPVDPARRPRALDAAALATLRAVLARVVPRPPAGLDLASRLDALLAEDGSWGDGWRPAGLPPDPVALRAAVATLDAASFASLDASAQDALLRRCAAGELPAAAPPLLGPAAMKLWFADLCGVAARLHVAHPATMARIGFSGPFAGGEDTRAAEGFPTLGEGTREPWEPPAKGAAS